MDSKVQTQPNINPSVDFIKDRGAIHSQNQTDESDKDNKNAVINAQPQNLNEDTNTTGNEELPHSDNQPLFTGQPQDFGEPQTDEVAEPKNCNVASGEDNAVVDTVNAVEMFSKMAQESIKKIMQGNFSDTSSDSQEDRSDLSLDHIISSDPKTLIISSNGFIKK